jgi:hypothetical protein
MKLFKARGLATVLLCRRRGMLYDLHVLQLSNISPSHTTSPLVIHVLLFNFLRSEVTLTCFSLTYWRFLPSYSNKQNVISITAGSKRPYTTRTWTVSPIYRDVTDMTVTRLIRSEPSVWTWEHRKLQLWVWHGSVFWRHCHCCFHVKSRTQLSVSNIFTPSLCTAI